MRLWKNRLKFWFLIVIIPALFLTGCDLDPAAMLNPKTVTISIVYGSEKQAWLEPLVKEYNNAKHRTATKATIQVTATAMGSIESVNAIIAGEIQPTVWSPASSVYIPVANSEWRKNHSSDLVGDAPKDLVVSPVVIAMWKPMAEALGYPSKPIGWSDIARLALSDKGWAAYNYPEWGSFKFGHTHPSFSNSGIISILAEAYAGANKQRDLTLADLAKPELKTFMTQVESSVIHYGSSTGFFATKMFTGGPSYLSAAVMYENLVVAQESDRLAGKSQQIPVVAIYPKEGTFWSNHPYVILNAPWVTDELKSAAQDFEIFLLDKPQQLRAMQLGFRTADPNLPITAPLDAQHGVDPTQPQTLLEIPTAEIIHGITDLWRETKKPVDLVVVLDTSGSMSGAKINAARSSLAEFINLLDDTDRLQVILFNSQMTNLSTLSPLGPKRGDLVRRVSGIIEGGNTTLYDTALAAYNELASKGDPKHIRAVVLLTDGNDTNSKISINQLLSKISTGGENAGSGIKIFTIGYGKDADKQVLVNISEATGGKQYDSNPETIRQVYADIATFF